MREMLVDDADAAAFEAYCRPFGGSLVGLLAATALIVHEIGGQPVYRTVVPFHTRAKSQWLDSVGWYVGGAPIEVPVAQAPDFDSALRDGPRRTAHQQARWPACRSPGCCGCSAPTSGRPPPTCTPSSRSSTPAASRGPTAGRTNAYGLIRVSYGDQVCAWVTRLHEGL